MLSRDLISRSYLAFLSRVRPARRFPTGITSSVWSWNYGKYGQTNTDLVGLDGAVYDFYDPEKPNERDAFDGSNAVVLSDGTANEWQKLYDSAGYFFIVRILPACFAIGLLALIKSFIRELLSSFKTTKPKILMLGVEAVVWTELGITFFVCGWYASSDWTPYEMVGTNVTFLAGSGFFVTFISALSLFEIKLAMKEMRSVRPILETFRRSIMICAFMFVGVLDLGMALSVMTNTSANLIISGMTALLLLSQGGVAGFFMYQGHLVTLMVKEQAEKASGGKAAGSRRRDGPMFKALHRMSRWLITSAVFMLLFVIALVVFGLSRPRTPALQCITFVLAFSGRAGADLTQVIASKPPRAASGGKKINLMSRRSSTESTYAEETVVSSTSSTGTVHPTG